MNKELILSELDIKAVRSGGAGGQNVNKVATKINLTFNIENSNGLTEDEKKLLFAKLQSKLSGEGNLIIQCDEARGQLKNKALAIKRFFDTLEKALVQPKPRKATQIPTAVKENRLKAKKSNAETKQNRRKPDF